MGAVLAERRRTQTTAYWIGAHASHVYRPAMCFGLSDEGMEDAVYNSQAIRRFNGIDLNVDTAPDATTLLKFRRLLETHNLTKVKFDTINGHLAGRELLLKQGMIVDATIIATPLLQTTRLENATWTCTR